jgi:hypothetical protein
MDAFRALSSASKLTEVKVRAPAQRPPCIVVTARNAHYGVVTRRVAVFRPAPELNRQANRRPAVRPRAACRALRGSSGKRQFGCACATPRGLRVPAVRSTAQTRDGVTCVNERHPAPAQDGGTARA